MDDCECMFLIFFFLWTKFASLFFHFFPPFSQERNLGVILFLLLSTINKKYANKSNIHEIYLLIHWHKKSFFQQ